MRSVTKDEIEFIKVMLLSKKFSLREIARRLNRDNTLVHYHAHKMGFTFDSYDKWTEDEIAILTEMAANPRYWIPAMSLRLNRSKRAISAKLIRLGIKRERSRAYYLDINFFLKDSNKLWYFIGYFYADGCIHKNSASLSSKDGDHLAALIDTFSAAPLCLRKDRIYEWQTKGEQLANLLKDKFQLTERKSLTMKWPTCVPNKYLPDFIRGYFDGDGCVLWKNYTKKLTVRFTSGSKYFLDRLMNVLLQFDIKGAITGGKNKFDLNYALKSSIKLYNLMYKSSCFYLKRKKEKFDKCFDYRIKNKKGNRINNYNLVS